MVTVLRRRRQGNPDRHEVAAQDAAERHGDGQEDEAPQQGVVLALDLDGRTAWVRDEDMAALQAPPPPRGLRLLPAEDPFLAQRDRATLLPDPRHQAQVWDPPVRPGVVLWEGWPVATWLAGTEGRTLVVHVSPLADCTLDVRVHRALDEEAAGLAIFYMCDQAQVEVLTDGIT